jgi:glycosyltransferase involved in cell wall biosynthesis
MTTEKALDPLKRAVKRSSLLQRAYSWGELSLGRLQLIRGRPFSAIDHFCKASRRVGVDTNSRRRARKHLRSFFSPNGNGLASAAREDFLRSPYAAALRSRFLPQAFPLNITFRGNLLPLKAYNPNTGEKGVLILTYNYLFQAFHAIFHSTELSRFYWMVLEPSYYRFEDPGYSLFPEWQVLLQAGNPVTTEAFQALGSPFHYIALTSSDWTDSDFFSPLPDQQKIYDLIYVANWAKYKQHELLFDALAKIRRPLRVALVGFRWERTRQQIESLISKYGLTGRFEIVENVPPAEVHRLLNQSRVNLLLSRLEAGNRALYEAMFANLPSVVYRHCEGLNCASINEQTGILADEHDLSDAILAALDRLDNFSPRAWALENTGYLRSTRIVNDRLREISLQQGEPWDTDIVAKVNRPEFKYKNPEDAARFAPILDHLRQFVRQ